MAKKSKSITYDEDDDEFNDELDDDLSENEVDEELINEINELDEDDIDDELNITNNQSNYISSLSFNEKKKLLLYKRKHTEVEWEEEIFRREQLRSKDLDYERLKQMTGVNTTSSDNKKAIQKTPRKPRTQTKKANINIDKESDDEEAEEIDEVEEIEDNDEIEEEEDEQNDDNDDEDDPFGISDDDLFDSDEELEQSQKFSSRKLKSDSKIDSKTDSKKSSKVDSKANIKSNNKNSRLDSKLTNDLDSDIEEGEIKKTKIDNKNNKSNLLVNSDSEYDSDITPTNYSNQFTYRKSNRSTKKSSKSDSKVDSKSDRKLDSKFDYDLDNKLDKEVDGELIDYLTIQHRRLTIEKYINEPFFNEVMDGAFVRCFVGQKHKTFIYRMAEIQEVDRSISRQYRLPGKKETTNIRLLLTIGGKKKKVKIDQISNSRITENEFNHYKQHLGERFKLLTKEQISNRYKKIQNASNHVYSQEEITQMVHNKQGYNKEMVTDFFTARNSLMKRRMKAIETQDFDELTIIDKQIDVLENKFKIDKEKCDKIAIKFVSINKRNREENFKKDVEAGKKKKLESNDGVVASSSINPYLRRETRPVNLWNTGVKLEKAKAEIDSVVTIPSTNQQTTTNNALNSSSANTTVANNQTIKHKIENDFYNYSTNFEEVRKRMRQRLGVDPYELSLEDPRERYLKKVCAGLPSIGSIERESIRKGLSLRSVLDQVALDKQKMSNQ